MENASNIQNILPSVMKNIWTDEQLRAELKAFRTKYPNKTHREWLVYVSDRMLGYR